ncbi:FmdB family zinc ribbon protein [Phenylobacterium soli]|uniref:Uncharacterized protein n=1 Tax=Phenylobacterium soli TaxID=2170551 RepID=A0A328ADZ6_9CAUL|nr:hypothetical protein [Phenylobacterium soli]RAK51624.1 hypothetical protein DJ017_17465 [Phenylobacterium soli]
MMKLCVSRELIISAPGRWEAQYRDTKDPKKQAITDRLRELDTSTATAAEVRQIIGNGSWSFFRCDECDQEVERAVRFTAEYSDHSTTLCPSCLRAAAALATAILP